MSLLGLRQLSVVVVVNMRFSSFGLALRDSNVVFFVVFYVFFVAFYIVFGEKNAVAKSNTDAKSDAGIGNENGERTPRSVCRPWKGNRSREWMSEEKRV